MGIKYAITIPKMAGKIVPSTPQNTIAARGGQRNDTNRDRVTQAACSAHPGNPAADIQARYEVQRSTEDGIRPTQGYRPEFAPHLTGYQSGSSISLLASREHVR